MPKHRYAACSYDCPDACSILVSREQDGLRLAGNPEHPQTRGFLCVKGKTVPKRLAHPSRITQPLRRRGDGFVPVSWDEALGELAERVQKLRATPGKLLHVKGFASRGPMSKGGLYLFGRLGETHGAARTVGGLCDDTGILACEADFGSLEQHAPTDLVNTTQMVNWGRDLTRAWPHFAPLVKERMRAGVPLTTISPGGTEHAAYADTHITLAPGTDRFLAAAVIKLLGERGLLLTQVASEKAERIANLDQFLALLDGYSLNDCLAACDVDRADAERLADVYATTHTCGAPVATLLGWGLQRHPQGGANVRFINALALLSGNVGLSGGGSSYNISSGRNLGSWYPRELLPPARTFPLPSLGRELLAAQQDEATRIELAFVEATNVVNQCPEARTTALAFEAVPFLVCVDGFWNDTVRRADLILPPALALEQEDILGSFHHHAVAYAGKAVEPPEGCRAGYAIARELGTRLSPPIELPEPEDALRAVVETSPHLGCSLEELRERGFVMAPHPEVPFADFVFAHPDGRYRLPEELKPEQEPQAGYPLRLLTLVRRDAIHSQLPPEELDTPDAPKEHEPPTVTAHPAAPGVAGLAAGARVRVVTEVGQLEALLALDETLHPSVLVLRRGGWLAHGRAGNALVAPGYTDLGQNAAFYGQQARLELG